MFGFGSLNKTLLVLITFAPIAASASGRWSRECEKKGREATQRCEGHKQRAGAADAGQAGAQQRQLGTGGVQHNGGNALQRQGQDQARRLSDAQRQCQQEQDTCKSECDAQERERQSKENLPNQPPPNGPPIKQEAMQDKGKVDEKKQSACIAPIALIMGDLGNGASQAAQAAQQAGNTAGASGGMPMPMPMPMPSDKKGDQTGAGSQANNPTPEKLNCDTEGNSKYSDCNNHYIEKCQSAMNSPGCDPFITRYCGNYNPTPTPTPPPGNDNLSLEAQSQTAATANLVANKQGEGLGSAFCKKATAYKFCQMAGRSQCPSCKNLNSPWPMESTPGALSAAKESCPTDPMFLDPATQAQMNNPTGNTPTNSTANTGMPSTQSVERLSSGGAAGMGSGGGGMTTQSSGAGGAGTAPGTGISEGYNGPSLALGSGGGEGGGGGGGNYNYEGSASGPGYQPANVNGNTNRAPNAAGQPRPDVANQYGPNIFSIQSATYRARCQRGQFLHCRR